MSFETGPLEVDAQHKSATLTLDRNVYSKAAVLRACYWFARDLSFNIEDTEEGLKISLCLRVTGPTLDAPRPKPIDDWVPDFLDALVDSQLRVQIQEETAAIRELIIAKAFAESGVLEDPPPGTFEDPVLKKSQSEPTLVKIQPQAK